MQADPSTMTDTPTPDALTGAHPRAALEPFWVQCVQSARAAGGACALLFFDIDHFKSVNDAFGHRRGDAVLQDVAQRVRASTRDSDRLFRYGGDEFVLVLPGTAKAEATELAQRVLDAVRRPMGDDQLVVGLSIGVAALPDDGDDAQPLLERADARSYEAKRRGRAQVVNHDGGGAAALPFDQLSRRIERDIAQAQARDFLARLARERRGVLTIAGPARAGRSTLLADVARLARLQSFHVLELAAAPADPPCGALVRALPAFAASVGTPDEAPALAALLRQGLADAGATRLLLCVDDLLALDWPTLYLLRDLLAGSTPEVLGLVQVVEGDAGPGTGFIAAPLQAQLQVQAFSEDGLRIWLRLLLQRDPPAAFVTWLGEQTGRLPGAVEQALRRLQERGTLRHGADGWQLGDDYARAGAEGVAAWRPREGRHNLPLQLTTFVGRESERDAVSRAVHAHRLVTLTGTGGTGKTRLALRAAGDLLDGFRHGVWFVDLARVSDAAGVAAAVATVIGVRKVRGRGLLAGVVAWAARREVLLVLDNCEHLVQASAELADALLHAGPGVRLLATSREPLAIAGEQVWHVPSLTLPAARDAADPRRLLDFESVRLFIERAAQAAPGFALDADNAAAVAQVCRRLDGIPLAIELAAARLRTLAPAQIAQRLDDRFALLTGGSRTALPRQQTLRALVDWSHDLLAPPEQALLRRLAVFAGGCTLEAAEEVCGGLAPLRPSAVLPLLAALTDKSLVVMHDDHGRARYRMLETIRHYALERQAEAGETAALRDRHLEAMTALAQACEPGLCGHDQQRWLERLDADADNLRAALAWAREHDAGAMLRLASALWRFWDLRGERIAGLDTLLHALQSGRGDAQHALGLARAAYMARNRADFAHADQLAGQALLLAVDGAAPGAEAMALFVRGASALELARTQEGRHALQQALGLFRATGDQGMEGTTLVFLGFEAEMRNDVAAARHWMEQGLEAVRRCGDRRRICHALVRLGFVAIAAGDAAQALLRFDEALNLGRAIGDKTYVANGLYLLGRAAAFDGDFPRARQLLHEVVAPHEGAVASEISWARLELAKLCWAEGDAAGFEQALQLALALTLPGGLDEVQATALVFLGHAARERGDTALAQRRGAEALAVFLRSRREGLCLCVELWALLALDAGDALRAARWLGAREALRERLFALDHYPFMLQRRATVVTCLHDLLGLEAFTAAWQAGRAQDEDALLAQAPGAP